MPNKLTQENFISNVMNISKQKGYNLDLSNATYINGYIKVPVTCRTHQLSFYQIPKTLLRGSNGCQKCISDAIINSKRRPEKYFIEEAKKKHGERFIYNEISYVDLKTPIKIICREHGSFIQSPTNHIKGAGCPKCSNRYKPTTEEFLIEATIIHGKRYDYSKVIEYKGRHYKIIIICRDHGEFEQTPDSHLRGSGCPKCAGNCKSDTEEFLQRCEKLSYIDQYDLSKVQYKTAITQVTIICRTHGEFVITPNSFLSGHGCAKCAGNQLKSCDTFIQEARDVHGNKYDYDFVEYVNSRTNVAIRCQIHGLFLQLPNNHLRGQQCPICQGCEPYSRETYVKKALDVHSGRYSYDNLIFKNTASYVCITCKDHGDFYQNAYSHLQGAGCRKCSIDKLAMRRRLTTDDFLKKMKNINGDRYDLSKVNYVSAIIPVTIICMKHGEFNATPNYLLSGHNCPLCARYSRYSKKCIQWLNLMNSIIYPNVIQHAENGGEFRITDTRWFADGYCQETNTIYEFHGDYWHGNPKCFRLKDRTFYGATFESLYKKTLVREEQIISKGFNLIVMWENDWDCIIKGFNKLQNKFRQTRVSNTR